MQNSDTCVQWNLDLRKIVATTNYDHHADGYNASAPHSEIPNCYLCKNTLEQTIFRHRINKYHLRQIYIIMA